MAKTSDVPEFGMLTGVKVVCTGSVIAAPYAATLMAEHGAQVIQVESTQAPDTIRFMPYFWEQEHRNELAMSLDIPGGGREVFFKLLQWADIFIESAKGGTYAKWGLTDDVLWEQNPKLVIMHISGYGQEGVPEYVTRASYDAVGQAFGGYSYINGWPEPMPPYNTKPYTCDYVTALNVAWSALAALRKVERTGEGESIDIAQFEMMTRVSAAVPIGYLNSGNITERVGGADPGSYGYEIYKCKNGGWVFIGAGGRSPFARALKVIGLQDHPDLVGKTGAMKGEPGSEDFQEAMIKFCAEHTNEEVDAIMNAAGVPCSAIFNTEMAARNPHYAAREVFTEWEDPGLGTIKGVNIMPRVKRATAKIWRGSPTYGQDTRDLLEEFGYSEEEINAMYESGAVK